MAPLVALLPAALTTGSAATAAGAGALVETGMEAAMLPTLALPSMSTVATTAAVGGTLLDAAGGLISANQQADVMEQNAKLAESEGEMKREAAKQETLKLSQERRRTIGAQTAAFGASGVDVGYGSPLDVMAQTAAEYERDIQLKGYAGDVGSYSSNMEASMYRYGARSKRTSGMIGAGGTLLTGFGRSLLGRY